MRNVNKKIVYTLKKKKKKKKHVNIFRSLRFHHQEKKSELMVLKCY